MVNIHDKIFVTFRRARTGETFPEEEAGRGEGEEHGFNPEPARIQQNTQQLDMHGRKRADSPDLARTETV